MKTTFDSGELPHKWAHQLAERGTCSQSMSFNRASIFSYAMEIGRVIEHKGKRAYLVNQYGISSVTTSKYQNAVRNAIPGGFPVFELSKITDGFTGQEIFDHAIKQASKALNGSKTARTRKDALLAEYSDWLIKANAAAEYFGLKCKADTTAIERLEKRVAVQKRKQAKAERERQTAIEKENAKLIAQWLAGDDVYYPSNVQQVRLRIQWDDGNPVVQTSRHVQVPFPDAERAFRFAVARRSKGWHRNGEECKVGDFQLDAVNEWGVIAGCHRIEWDEIERFAKLQGWIK